MSAHSSQTRHPSAGRSFGVYVHFPWCLRKCPYCDFASFERERAQIDHSGYAGAVLAELDARCEALCDRRLESVFFGGGTPSLWEPEELGRVLEAILQRASARGDVEVTVECNPSSLDEGRARAYTAVGVNRLSVGVQALDARRLAFLGRVHDPGAAIAAVRAAMGSGARVNADVMIGIATGFARGEQQTPAEAAADVAAIADLGVAHLSAYQLTVEPRTRFGELMRAGRLPLVADDQMAESFLLVSDTLQARGLLHYEISNFAREGQRCQHNLGYWRGDDYLGLGCAAYGTLSSGTRAVRYRNAPNPERYLAQVAAGDFSSHEHEELDGETRLRERIMLGLRLREGIDIERAAAELGVEPWPEPRRRATGELCARGRLEVSGTTLRIPRHAWLFTDGTAAALF